MSRFAKLSWAILKWLFYIVFGLLVLLFLFIEGFDRYIATDKGALWLFKNLPNQNMEIRRTPSGVRYLSIGDEDKPLLMLIHGAPGSLYDWKSFAKRADLYDQYRVLIVERPGYGGTKPRKAEPSIKIQAARILEVLDKEGKSAVVMGHSYGGPIAVAMAAMSPNMVSKVIGVSGQYDPDNEITFRISYFINFKLFKYLLPRFIWASNVEKLTHPDALREILTMYAEVKTPIVLLHGDSDTLVPYENSPFLMNLLHENAEMITLPGWDHPIHMTESDYLVDFVLGKRVMPEGVEEDEALGK